MVQFRAEQTEEKPMKAWVLKAFGRENLALEERPRPTPGPGEVLLEMRAASLNYRDLVVSEGGYGRLFRTPLVPLSDGAGVVVDAGPGVKRVAVGDRVAPLFFEDWTDGEATPEKFRSSRGGSIPGVMAEYLTVAAAGVAVVPDHLSDEEAASLPCAALTAWSAIVTEGRVRPGDVVLIQGTGGVALSALQFAKMAGARTIVTSSSDDKLARARALGADETVNYRTRPDWDQAALDFTAGRGVDLVVELGGADTLARSLRAVRTGGTLAVIGVLSGRKAEFNLPAVVSRNLRVQGVTVGSRAGFEAMVRALEFHRTRITIDSLHPFDALPDAFERLAGGGHFGKVCLRIR